MSTVDYREGMDQIVCLALSWAALHNADGLFWLIHDQQRRIFGDDTPCDCEVCIRATVEFDRRMSPLPETETAA